jgi:hypothetical protein
MVDEVAGRIPPGVIYDIRHKVMRLGWRLFHAETVPHLTELLFGPAAQAGRGDIQNQLLPYLIRCDPNADGVTTLNELERYGFEKLSAEARYNVAMFRCFKQHGKMTLKEAMELAIAQLGGNIGYGRARDDDGDAGRLAERIAQDIVDDIDRPPRLVPAKPVDDVGDLRKLFVRLTPDDALLDFWSRDSTYEVIQSLAKRLMETDVTVYAGCDGASDVGLPLTDPLIEDVATDWLVQNKSFEGYFDSDEVKPDRPDTLRDVVRWISLWCGSRFTGSVLRELVSAFDHGEGSGAEQLRGRVKAKVEQERLTSGLVSRSVMDLVYALKAKKRVVEIITSYVDDDLETIAVSNADGGKPAIEVHQVGDKSATSPAAIRLTYLAGQTRRPDAGDFLLGESDFFTAPPEALRKDTPVQGRRVQLLQTALVNTTVIFVGTSLTDPSLVSALAATRHFLVPRYVLLIDPGPDALAKLSLEHRRLIRFLIAQRFLHLNCVPIQVEFPQQITQLLHEVAHLVRSKNHLTYRKRRADWWKLLAPTFGRATGSAASLDERTRYWNEVLRDSAEATHTLVVSNARDRGWSSRGDIILELWIHEPSESRDGVLFHAGTSDPNAELTDDLELSSYDKLTYETALLPVRVFRDGAAQRTVVTNDCMDPKAKDEMWLAVPLTIESKLDERLPVGALVIRSHDPRGGLYSLIQTPGGVESLRTNIARDIELTLTRPTPRK